MAHKCAYPGCINNSEGEFCFRHKKRKSIPKRSNRKIEEIRNNPKTTDKRDRFFLSLWNTRPHKSEISGEILYGEISSLYFHHILEKENYKDLEFEPENIIFVTWIEHDNLHIDKYRYEEVNKRREQLLKKFYG